MAYQYAFFEVTTDAQAGTAWVYLNRPQVKNAMNGDFWFGLPDLVAQLEADTQVQVVIVAGRGDAFSSGLDIKDFYLQHREKIHGPLADEREGLRQHILTMQQGLRRLAASPKVFIAAVHGYCIGAGLDLAAACDLRLCSTDAVFSLREAKVGIVADMGSLARLPGIIGQGATRLMALTGRDVTAQEALQMGLVQQLLPTQAALWQAAQEMAAEVAANPAIAVRGTKHLLNYMEEHGVEDSMNYVALWNAAFLDSQDFRKVIAHFLERRQPNSH